LYIAIGLLAADAKPISDEIAHYVHINWFDHGKFKIAGEILTVLPGYHAISAAILWVTDLRTLCGVGELSRFRADLTPHLLARLKSSRGS